MDPNRKQLGIRVCQDRYNWILFILNFNEKNTIKIREYEKEFEYTEKNYNSTNHINIGL